MFFLSIKNLYSFVTIVIERIIQIPVRTHRSACRGGRISSRWAGRAEGVRICPSDHVRLRARAHQLPVLGPADARRALD